MQGWNRRLTDTTHKLRTTSEKLMEEKQKLDALIVRQYEVRRAESIPELLHALLGIEWLAEVWKKERKRYALRRKLESVAGLAHRVPVRGARRRRRMEVGAWPYVGLGLW